jgi:hypothetical protein
MEFHMQSRCVGCGAAEDTAALASTGMEVVLAAEIATGSPTDSVSASSADSANGSLVSHRERFSSNGLGEYPGANAVAVPRSVRTTRFEATVTIRCGA